MQCFKQTRWHAAMLIKTIKDLRLDLDLPLKDLRLDLEL